MIALQIRMLNTKWLTVCIFSSVDVLQRKKNNIKDTEMEGFEMEKKQVLKMQIQGDMAKIKRVYGKNEINGETWYFLLAATLV